MWKISDILKGKLSSSDSFCRIIRVQVSTKKFSQDFYCVCRIYATDIVWYTACVIKFISGYCGLSWGKREFYKCVVPKTVCVHESVWLSIGSPKEADFVLEDKSFSPCVCPPVRQRVQIPWSTRAVVTLRTHFYLFKSFYPLFFCIIEVHRSIR